VFVRRLVAFLFLGALLAGLTAGISTAGGFNLDGTIYFPPLVNVTLPVTCHAQFDQGNTLLTCHNTAPNPNPPKDTKTAKFTNEMPKGPCKLTVYSDGNLLLQCRFKGEVLFT
jgi:hypothetical protein